MGLFVGIALSGWLEALSQRERVALNLSQVSRSNRLVRCVSLIAGTSLLFAGLTWAELVWGTLETPEVQPSDLGRQLRLCYHLVLVSLLIVATAIDFDCYVIPDQVTIPGMLFGLLGAVAVADLQICHLWVDWSVAIPQLRGPEIPAWFDAHRSMHALAWSSSGLMMGATLTWLARAISSYVLGQEAMGFGDVTLMAMIGCFLGWQPVVIVFLAAPIAGLTLGIVLRLISGRTFLPYGPWLSIATLLVLFSWNWLWRLTRITFSDLLSVLLLFGIGGVGLVLLLSLLSLYRSIPVRSNKWSRKV